MTRQITTRFSYRSIERFAAPIDPHFRIALEKDEDIEGAQVRCSIVFLV